MKSKVEIREFAIRIAADIMGNGTPCKDIVSKAKEIEQYIIGEVEIPDISNIEQDMLGMLKGVTGLIGAKDVE